MLFHIKSEFIKRSLIIGFFLLQYALAWAQIAEEGVDQTLYVNLAHPQASDQNPGNQILPFKTISKAAAVAAANNARNVGTKILIEAGTYREEIPLHKNGRETNAPIIFEAVSEVIVSGSDVWTGWQRVEDTNVFSHPWPYQWGLAPIPAGWEPHVILQDIVRRSEMVFVNGMMLDQVLSYSELQAGSFCVDEKARTVYIKATEGMDVANAAVEVALRPEVFSVSGKTNLVLRGIIFQHGKTSLDGQAVRFDDSSNILVENCQFRWNNWGGLGFRRSRNVTARRNMASYNGGAGIGTWKMHTLFFEENETSHNNWRGKKGGFTGWAVAGIKNLHTHGGIFLRHKSVDNQSHGIWFDTDCENIVVKEAVLCTNLRHGVYLEANQGPITIRNSLICRNINYGVLIANSAGVNLERNIFYGNATSQIMVSGLYDSARPENNWETGGRMALLAEQSAWINNFVVGTEARQFLVSTTLSPSLWRHFVESLKSNRNVWFNSQESRVFQVAGGDRMNFEAWQLTTRQDGNSSFADPRFKDPANDDFQVLPDSPMKGIERGVSMPDK